MFPGSFHVYSCVYLATCDCFQLFTYYYLIPIAIHICYYFGPRTTHGTPYGLPPLEKKSLSFSVSITNLSLSPSLRVCVVVLKSGVYGLSIESQFVMTMAISLSFISYVSEA